MTLTTCDRCETECSPEAIALGWPVPVGGTDDVEYVCPDCYGDDGYCPEGHVLSGTDDSSHCAVCETA